MKQKRTQIVYKCYKRIMYYEYRHNNSYDTSVVCVSAVEALWGYTPKKINVTVSSHKINEDSIRVKRADSSSSYHIICNKKDKEALQDILVFGDQVYLLRSINAWARDNTTGAFYITMEHNNEYDRQQ